MLVVIGTKNQAKCNAVKQALERVWPDAEVVTAETGSGVSKMPTSNEETITGSMNRAAAALKAVPGADLGIGPEGGVFTNEYGMFLLGWVVVMGRDGRRGTGASGAVAVPAAIRKRIEAGEELGPIMQELMSDEANLLRQAGGANGVLTGGLYDRVKEFTDATLCALAPWRSDLYR